MIQAKEKCEVEQSRLRKIDLLSAGVQVPCYGTSSASTPAHERVANANISSHVPKVAILLCTFHGQRYLAEQLDSFEVQDATNWEVWASDDGSDDDTHAILAAYREKWGNEKLSIHSGPAGGFVANFLSLTCNPTIRADYYAYSDQDDVWEADKLSRAVAWLESLDQATPAMYCSRTRLVDENNKSIGFSPLFTKSTRFENALVQSVAGGNTMVFNHAARELLTEGRADINIVSHDWWVYMVVTGCGGIVFYDPYPSLRYRQHEKNVVGMNSSVRARVNRIGMLFKGHFRGYTDRNLPPLQRLNEKLTPENQRIFTEFSNARDRWILPRIIGFARSGIYRQTLLGNLGLVVAAIFKKI